MSRLGCWSSMSAVGSAIAHEPTLMELEAAFELVDLVFEQRCGDGSPTWLALQECRDELLDLLVRDLGRHRRLVRVDHHVDQCRTWIVERFLHGRLQLARLLHVEASPSVLLRERGEAHGCAEPNAMLGKPQGDLLPEDLPERAVVADEYLDRQVVPRRGVELRHQHGEPAIAYERDALAPGMGHLCRDRVRKT